MDILLQQNHRLRTENNQSQARIIALEQKATKARSESSP